MRLEVDAMYAFRPIKDLLNVMFSPTCVACGEALVGDEHLLCLECLSHIPYTNFATMPDNPLEKLLEDTIPHATATSLMYFEKNEVSQSIIHGIKYYGNLHLAKLFGGQLGESIIESHRFDDLDMIIPVPLHPLRWMQRGYNQSREISRSISGKLGIPIGNHLIARTHYTTSQTRKSHHERSKNVSGAFKPHNLKQLNGKHVLLVDDVITTGSTVKACYAALTQAEGVRVSVASLAFAG